MIVRIPAQHIKYLACSRITLILYNVCVNTALRPDAPHLGEPGHGHGLGDGHQPHLETGQKVPQVQAPGKTNGKRQ